MKKIAFLILCIPVLFFSLIVVKIYSTVQPSAAVRSCYLPGKRAEKTEVDKVMIKGSTNAGNNATELKKMTGKAMEDSLITELPAPPLKFYSAEN